MNTLATRLIDRDVTLWPEGNVAPNRLGWVSLAERMIDDVTAIEQWAKSVTAETIVLIGMGGSSLGPEVLRSAIGSERVIVVDTTDPATIADVPTNGSFYIVSSKSGGTLEVQAMLAHFWDREPNGNQWAAITDPGTELESLARERKFSKVFTNPADIGGRFSVLSYFGLVPAALMGYDLQELCQQAIKADVEEAVDLGLQMAKSARDGKDKITIVIPAGKFATFSLWIEQLIAESTGKQGLGCIPVPTTEPEDGPDRFVEWIKLDHPTELGREFYRWEIATAIAGHALEIDPFDEPNVTESKANTKRVLDSLPLQYPPTENASETLAWLKETVKPGDYVSIQAYLPYSYEFELEQLRRRIRDELGGIAVTAGFGPRFLHSTGQLHKGGGNNIVAVQLVPSQPSADLAIPGRNYDFATLINAQAIGDYESLKAHDRRVRRVSCRTPKEVQ